MDKFKPLVSKENMSNKLYSSKYICTCFDTEKDFIKLRNTDITLQVQRKSNRDHRQSHPSRGTVISASEGAQFKEGTEIICKHFAFEDFVFNPKHFYTGDSGIKYYNLTSFDIMFGVVDGKLVNRKGILLCKPIVGKFIDTELEVLPEMYGNRRDIVEVVQIWEGCTEFKVGDYLMLKMGADYTFTFNDEEFIKVDHYFNDVYAVVGSPDWYDSVASKHVDHYRGTDSINERGF